MKWNQNLTRRQFATTMTVSAAVLGTQIASGKSANRIPVGLELYSVRHELEKDASGTLDRVAQIGYDCVEFYAPYAAWATDHAKEVRAQLDRLKLRCYSTHNGMDSFAGAGLDHAIELNKILGTHYLVLSSAGSNVKSGDDWKRVADTLNSSNQKLQSAGLHAGYHNHAAEWKPVDGKKPMEILAANTDKTVMLQLDVGTCVEAGSDPVAWIESNPGRIKSLHLKEWSPDTDYKALFGEGKSPWKQIFAAAEKHGGVEYYLIEQEGSRFPEFETAERCLVAYKNLRNGSKKA